MSKPYKNLKNQILEMLGKRIEPTFGDFGSALEDDLAIDPPLGDLDACVCSDDDSNPINKCNECSR